MRTVGIIAEYNPFHTGHAYHLERAKEMAGADFALVVMSPDFVQRGEPAVFDKYTRTRMALAGGADLVLELPLRFATGSAEYFAQGALALLDGLGVVDALCFGAETDDPELFLGTARILEREPDEYIQILKQFLKTGMTFPQARMEALAIYTDAFSEHTEDSVKSELFATIDISASVRNKTHLYLHDNDPGYPNYRGSQDNYRTFLSAPNNILGIEYCRALLRLDSPITALPVRREGSCYNSLSLDGTFCSATALRRELIHDSNALHRSCNSKNDYRISGTGQSPDSNVSAKTLRHIPESCRSLFVQACRTACYPELFMPYLDEKLLAQDCFTHILDITPDLSDRMSKKRFSCIGKSWRETVALLKTKQITEARIRRALLHLILDIRQDSVKQSAGQPMIPYARLLGFRTEAAPLLHEMKQNSSFPLISKNANAGKLLSENALRMWEQDIFASHLYRSAVARTYCQDFKTEYEMSPVIL